MGERELTFDFAGGLVHDNLLFVDRETDSIWSQLHGRSIAGEMEGAPLEVLASLQTTWGFWKREHPDTRVMILDRDGRPYVYRNRLPGTPPPEKRPTEHDTTRLGLGFSASGKAIFYPFSELDKTTTPLEIEIGERRWRLHYEAEALTAWVEDEAGELVPSVLAYDFGWRDFYPETEVFSVSE